MDLIPELTPLICEFSLMVLFSALRGSALLPVLHKKEDKQTTKIWFDLV